MTRLFLLNAVSTIVENDNNDPLVWYTFKAKIAPPARVVTFMVPFGTNPGHLEGDTVNYMVLPLYYQSQLVIKLFRYFRKPA